MANFGAALVMESQMISVKILGIVIDSALA